MGIRHALALGLFLFAVPAGVAAQPAPAALAEQELAAGGAWLERASLAMGTAAEGFQELSARMQAFAAQGPTKEKAAAAAPAMRQLIGQARTGVRRSNEMLAALPPFPLKKDVPFSSEQIVADARAQNARFLTLLDDNEVFIDAMARGDNAAMGRVLPRILEGAFSLLGHQRLILRNRQATIPATQSSHQATGVAIELYRAMELVGRHVIAAKQGGAAGAAKAAAALGPELAKGARNVRTLAAAGRKNLAAEVATLERARSEARSDADKRLLEKVRRLSASEEGLFALADRLAGLMEANAAISGPDLAAHGLPTLYASLTDIEAAFVDLSGRQASIMAEPAG